ncbi:MAG: gliding motility-associated C-terminal domain-containing protein [Bacteroidia bacterium]|nr:gliding motility-associated C-terminal domain-containing protein [Bacteroidia bacterium]
MKSKSIIFSLIIFFIASVAFGQPSQLYFQNFESGPGSFTLNNGVVGGNTGTNEWIWNNSYTGGGSYPNSMSEDSTYGGNISYAPFSHYLHIYDAASPYTDCLYNPANQSDRFTSMTSGICTLGYDSVTFNFFYLCEGSPTAYGQVYYKRDNDPWTQCGQAQYSNKHKWQYTTISNTAFGNASNLYFGFRWINNAGAGKDTSAFAIDDIEVVGVFDTNKLNPKITCHPSPDTICAGGGASIFLTINISDTLCDGTYNIQMVDSNHSTEGGSLPGWTANIYNPDTTATFLLNIPPNVKPGHCYHFIVSRTADPKITGEYSICIYVENCPPVITTLQPLVTTESGHPVCAGSVIQTPFWSVGQYSPSNTYFAILSDSAGNFTPGYPGDTIGNLPSNSAFPPYAIPPTPGVCSGILPFKIPAGCHYKIEVVSDKPPTVGSPFGPFCIQNCDIYTDSSHEKGSNIQACIGSCYKDPKGWSDSITYTIHKYDSNEKYFAGNKFEVQILSTSLPPPLTILNTGGLGATYDTVTGKLVLHIPCGDSLCNDLGLPAPVTGTYYMRVIATNSNQADSTYGTLMFLNIGWPQDSISIWALDGTNTYCVGDVPAFYPLPYSFCTNNWNGGSLWSWWFNNFQKVNNSPNPGIGIQLNAIDTIALICQENNGGCLGPLDTMKIYVKGPPSVAITGPPKLCVGDTATYTVPFANNNYYKWTANKSKLIDTANNTLTVKYDTAGIYFVKIYALDSCGSASYTKQVRVVNVPVASANNDSACRGTPMTLTASGGTSYQWSTGAISASITVSPSHDTTYWVTASNGTCSSPKDTVYVKVWPMPQGNVFHDSTIISGGTANLSVLPALGGQSYLWSPNVAILCDTCPITTASPTVTTAYFCTISTGKCSMTDSTLITVLQKQIECGDVWAPDAFSPNGDGQNDVFYVKGNPACISSFNLIIYDRWGNKVFTTTSITNGWDGTYLGKPMNAGTYAYYVQVLTTTNQTKELKGSVTLVR